MAKSIPEIVTTLQSLPPEARQATLDQIAERFGPLEAPPKPELTEEQQETERLRQQRAQDDAKAAAEREANRIKQAQGEIIGALNTLGSDDLAIALSAIAANVGVASAKRAAKSKKQ